jgi:hypothetical protein
MAWMGDVTGQDEGELFITMEMLEGEALAERLRQGPLSSTRVGQVLGTPLGLAKRAGARHSLRRDPEAADVRYFTSKRTPFVVPSPSPSASE